MNTTSFTTRNFNPRVAPEQQALVLGGGGSAGNAWLIGVIAGLFEAGVDTTTADLMIGTSAGSTAAAQIACADPSQLLADILSSVPKQRPPQTGVRGESGRQGTAGDSMRRTGEIIAAAKNPADMRRRMGAAALDLAEDSGELGPQRWRETVAARLPSLNWPEKRLLITAVDAHTGEPTVFDRASGIELVDAVAASCANGPAYSIGDGAFIDGGYRRSSENADLAAGYGRVLVLSPLGGRTRHPLEWGMQLEVQVAELRASGSAVEVILPDSNSLAAFGANMMDQSTRPAAARAGYNQGRTIAGDLTGFWR
ncbi:patatin-like phospholipase family protein [Arthrobacter sp. BF1]|uniref:patatin-like phospholipase family protein n=1 Tax=Arthrobacter sp. BF1 TaxID=2821145 RepID=UPI001C4E4E50|nr:patatin-like phospholipase family protein [Arthrobacter sp. BF1]